MREKYQEIQIQEHLWGPDHYIYGYEETENEVTIRIKSKPHKCRCPHCGMESDKRSATYERRIQDIPWHGKTTMLAVRAYKYRCVNPDCRVVTFNEVLPFAHGMQRRTDALDILILAVSLHTSAEGASQILSMIGVRISNDAIQNLWKNVEFKDEGEVTEIGVDDVATRKGRTYATAVYDKSNGGRLLALLEGRDGAELRKWLQEHPQIKRVARDRAGAYAKVLSEVLPDCVQVADRYHLFANLSDHLRKFMKSELPDEVYVEDGRIVGKEKKPSTGYREKRVDTSHLHYDTSPPLDPDGVPIEIDAQRHAASARQSAANAESRQRKKELIQRVQELYHQGMNRHQIALKLGISNGSACKYAAMTQQEIDALDHPARRADRKHRVGEECIPIMYKMMADGHDDVTIISYLRAQGYEYALGTLHARLRAISLNHFPKRKSTSHPNKILEKDTSDSPDGPTRYSQMDIFYAVMTQDEGKLSAKEDLVSLLPKLALMYPAISQAQEIVRDFHEAMDSKDAASLQKFIDKHRQSAVSGFCMGLEMDRAAVANAISTDVNSGWVEGSNNRFKLIKRTMYGRAGLLWLERKCKAAFALRTSESSLSDLIRYKTRKRPWDTEQTAV